MRLNRAQLPCDEATFREKLADYLAVREAHRQTIGIPAPFPEFEVFRVIAEQGGDLEIFEDAARAALTDKELRAQALEAKRAAALRALDDARLVEAAKDPQSPAEVKTYFEALEGHIEAAPEKLGQG